MKKEYKKVVSCSVDPELHDNLKILCVEYETSQTQIINGYLKELERQRKAGSKYVKSLLFLD